MPDDLAQRLRAATGASDRFRISVMGEDSVAPMQHEFNYPYVVIGRGEGCDILLQNPRVSFRHAYLQVIEGRVFCVDLASRNGVFWPDGPRKFGWVRPDEPIQIGPYILSVMGDDARDRRRKSRWGTSIRSSATGDRRAPCRPSTSNSAMKLRASRRGR